jgi:1,4-dihydroxy-2-naphthoate octaprenyltransferase
VDFKEDKKVKKITTTIKFGIKNSLFFLKICLLLIILVSILIFQKFPLISISSSVLSFCFFPIKKAKRITRKKFKIAGIIVGIVYLLELLNYIE